MSDYEPMGAPRPEGPRRHPAAEPPPSVRTAVTLVWAIVGVSVVNALLTFAFVDDIVAATVEAAGAGDLSEEAIRASIIVSGLFALIVFGVLWVVLAIFLRRGANWARIVLTVLAGIGVVFGLLGLATGGQPALFMATGLITLVLQIALLFYLWQKDSTAYLKPQPR